MNALAKALDKVDAEIERIALKLDDVEAYNYKTSNYKHDAFTRQGAAALAGELRQAGGLIEDLKDGADGSYVVFGNKALDRIAERWNSREDWRQGAFAANVAKAVERLVGLS